MTEVPDLVLTTRRLSLHRITVTDAPFIFQLVNEAPFLEHIGDKGVRNLDDAKQYIRDVPMADYDAHCYGGYLVRLKDDGTPIGMCGLYKRANLDCPDLGFAFAEAWCGQGFAVEASRGVIEYARNELHLREIAAVVSPGNARSAQLIGKLGFHRDGLFRMPNETEDLHLYRLHIDPAA